MFSYGGKEYIECFSLANEVKVYSLLTSTSFKERDGVLLNEDDIFVKHGKIATKMEVDLAFSLLPKLKFEDRAASNALIRGLCGAKLKRPQVKKPIVVEEESESEEEEEEEDDEEEEEEDEDED